MTEALAEILAGLGQLLEDVVAWPRRRSVRVYSDDEGELVVTVAEASRKRIREWGNRVFVWGSATGGYGLLHADTAAPADRIRFRRLLDDADTASFHLYVDESLDLPGLALRCRGWRRIDVEPRYG